MPAKTKQNLPEGFFPPVRLIWVRLFVVIAALVDVYLAVVSLQGGNVVGCGPNSNCDKVLHSPWSRWLGVPVSLLALGVYGAVLAGTFRLGRKTPPVAQRRAWLWLTPCAVAILGAALWFIFLQFFVIRSLCPYCMVAHSFGAAAALLLLSKIPFRPAPDKPWQVEKQVFVPPALGKKLALVGAAFVTILVAGQLIFRPNTFTTQSVASLTSQPKLTNFALLSAATNPPAAPVSQIKTVPPPPALTAPTNTVGPPRQPPAPPSNAMAATSPSALASNVGLPTPPRPPVMDLALPPPKRPFTIYGGLFTFDLDEVPIMGSSEAPYRIVSLFDYTCHHCRIMHGYLMQLNKLFSNQLAIISVPSPFDGACNFTVKRTPRVHTNACAYARLGLAVWRANRGAHPQFEEYLFAPETPPPLEEAFQYALKLAGPAALVKAADDPWVPRQLHQGISVYATNLTSLHNGALPQVIIGTNLVSGMISGLQDLLPHLERQFGLKPGG